MKIKIETDYLKPIKIKEFEWVSVILPDGKKVTVFNDKVYVATPEEVLEHKDGRVVWNQ